MQKTITTFGLLALGLGLGVATWWMTSPRSAAENPESVPPPKNHATQNLAAQTRPANDPENQGVRVELVRPHQGTFLVVDQVNIPPDAKSFELEEQLYQVQARWENTLAKPVIHNDAPSPMCAVELAWDDESEDERIWVGQTRTDDPLTVIESLDLHTRVLPAGDRWVSPEQLAADMTLDVRFIFQGEYYKLPEVDQKVFEDWSVRDVVRFEHALLDDQGGITEDTDVGFPNRALQVDLAHPDGTIERHLCFLDHPALTQGTHPQVNPTTTLSGKNASHARLAGTQRAPHIPQRRLIIAADTSEAIEVIVVSPQGAAEHLHLEGGLPYSIAVGDKTIRLVDHRTNARTTATFFKAPADEDASANRPAWVVAPSQNPQAPLILPQGVAVPTAGEETGVFLRLQFPAEAPAHP